MRSRTPRRMGAIGLTALALLFLATGCGPEYIVLNPAGPVGREELHLIELSTVLVLIVIVPVLALLAFIVIRYRDRPGSKAGYTPEWSESKWLEVVWWGVPIVIVGLLGYYTGKSTFALVQPPEKDVKPLTIQVTSLDWKWLFQYPGQKVATVNYCEIPTGVPVQFVLTSDAPMNSFWVPQLGGQEYTMPGMAMRLWLQADKPGSYFGTGANFTGKGFAHMHFQVVAKSDTEFNQWVKQVKSSSPALTMAGYNKLQQPGTMGTASYSSYPKNLFDKIVWKNGGRYMPNMMMDQGLDANMAGMSGMSSQTSKDSNAHS
ncbi:ubiquinol oxidase subunit II [Alicyclobacillus kakegawensis]|uniref:ubiquinol oxidase subunit II n=1 Tax=Alicyclobacillus kakegawensis TaxID=392012 RepID=UPI000A57124B|nr:COX aromatic rich motif-containing protein [Alicyclobacillus kakegawensis]